MEARTRRNTYAAASGPPWRCPAPAWAAATLCSDMNTGACEDTRTSERTWGSRTTASATATTFAATRWSWRPLLIVCKPEMIPEKDASATPVGAASMRLLTSTGCASFVSARSRQKKSRASASARSSLCSTISTMIDWSVLASAHTS